MALFEPAWKKLFDIEGGYAPDDAGCGPVKFGLNARTLKQLGYPCDDQFVRNMTPEFAASVAKEHWWDFYHCGEIRDQALAETFFIAVYNTPPAVSVKALQNAVNDVAWAGLEPDGVIGPRTLAAVNAADAANVQWAFKMHLTQYYIDLAHAQPERHKNDLGGWLKRARKS